MPATTDKPVHTPEFVALNIAILTVSDRRTEATDVAGQALADRLQQAGHRLVQRTLVTHHLHRIRAIVAGWIADDHVNVVITSGGTGLGGRDITPDAIRPLLDRDIAGFGEIFRALSFQEIDAAAIQSNAFAGTAYNTYVFCLPGSKSACALAWDRLIGPQLDNRNGRCNLVQAMAHLLEPSR